MAPTLTSTTVRIPGLVMTEHELVVPLDHAAAAAGRLTEQLTVFAREVAAPDGPGGSAGAPPKPLLLFLQGGPGQESPRPTAQPSSPGWLARALADFRVVLLDQRGTGRSAPVGDLPGMSPQQQADHLAHFRADSVVADAELLRAALGAERWHVLGQSFGGFCALRYLSAAPQSLAGVVVTGGLPPVGRHPDEVYAATWARMRTLSQRYHARYPGDADRVRALHAHLQRHDVRTPAGDRLTPRVLRAAGHSLGMSDGAEELHALLERPADSPAFRADAADPLGLGRNPLYLLLHEACYADGARTAWSADRTRPAEFDDDATLFFGEHLHPWLLEDVGALAPVAQAAQLLADRPWPRLYDEGALTGVAREVPVAAAVYADDPYVEAPFSLETAHLLGARTWLTDEHLHNGLRADPAVLDRLLAMVAGRA